MTHPFRPKTTEELAVKVAEVVMRQKYGGDYCDRRDCEGKTKYTSEGIYRCMVCGIPDFIYCPNYCTSIEAAWEVVGSWPWQIVTAFGVTATIGFEGENYSFSASTAPLAICCAALKAHGIEVDLSELERPKE